MEALVLVRSTSIGVQSEAIAVGSEKKVRAGVWVVRDTVVVDVPKNLEMRGVDGWLEKEAGAISELGGLTI